MSAPISGASEDLGTEMKKGVGLAFDLQNAQGGIRGRPLQLVFKDDQYVPAQAEAAVRELLDVKDQSPTPARCPTTASTAVSGPPPVASGALGRGPNAVLGLLGNVGTPTMVRTAPIAVETGSLFFGAFTGAAKMLRDAQAGPCAKYIFNVRASYAQEARATLEYFLKQGVPDLKHLVSFDQNDTFGQAGYDGLNAAWTALKGPIAPDSPIARYRYTRDDPTSVPAQVTAATTALKQIISADSAQHVFGVLMTDTYGPGSLFIQGVKDWHAALPQDQQSRTKLLFSNVSFVGPNSLAGRLRNFGTAANGKPYTEGVFVSQIVPNYQSDTSDMVRDYLKALANAQLTPSFTSLEGYVAARIFIAGLVSHDGTFTADSLVDTYEHLPDLGLGLGANAGFAPGHHQYSQSVWGTSIEPDGSFTNRYFWSDGSPIQLFD